MWTAIEIIGLWCIMSVPIGIVVAGLIRNDDEPEFVLVLVVPRSTPAPLAAGLGAPDPAVYPAAVGGALSREKI